ncbi:MAG: erythromycin esterase family protein [Rhodospirillaceae bacterium]
MGSVVSLIKGLKETFARKFGKPRISPVLLGKHIKLKASDPGLLLTLRWGDAPKLLAELSKPRLERAIYVIYRPETELARHYFEANLTRQFDQYIWIDRTSAISPLPAGQIQGMPDTYPFGV